MPVSKLLKNPVVTVPLIAGVLLPCIAFLVLHFSYNAKSKTPVSFKDGVVISGAPLPKTNLLDLNGNSVSTDTMLKGKVLLVFMSTGCQPCRKEMKLLSSVESEISGKVRVYGVGVESRGQILNFIKENEVGTNIVQDEDGTLMRALSVKYFPTKFLIDNGVIVKTWFGNSASQADLFQQLGL
jgi:peroxiredoxin